ncbi:MAG: hypothetical protein IIY00_01765, partial [Clostridia bacterium]|nr:hypothetical protein [Clostridia bacterium]
GMAMTVDRTVPGLDLVCTDPHSARKLENSSLDAPGIYMLHAGISRGLEIGPANIQAHIRSLYEKLWDGLKALGIEPVTPRAEIGSCAAVAFDLPDKTAFFEGMKARGIVLTNSRLLRISLGAFNTEEDVEKALIAAKESL